MALPTHRNAKLRAVLRGSDCRFTAAWPAPPQLVAEHPIAIDPRGVHVAAAPRPQLPARLPPAGRPVAISGANRADTPHCSAYEWREWYRSCAAAHRTAGALPAGCARLLYGRRHARGDAKVVDACIRRTTYTFSTEAPTHARWLASTLNTCACALLNPLSARVQSLGTACTPCCEASRSWRT